MADLPNAPARGRGRPRKFTGPSRHVSITLPEHVIEALGRIDTDLSSAIVRVASRMRDAFPRSPAELSRFGQRAVIVVGRSRTLEQRAGVDLIPLPDGRALISFDRARTVADVELTIADALDDEGLSRADRDVFEGVAKILKDARRSTAVALRQRSIIVLEVQSPQRRPRVRRAKGPAVGLERQ